MKDNLEVLEVEEKEVKDMTKSELTALISQQRQALDHQEAKKEHSDKLIESLRDNSIQMQKEFETTMDGVSDRVESLVAHYEAKIDGVTQVMDGAMKLLYADKHLETKKEEEN